MALRLGTIRRVFCASPAYLAARGTPRTPHELAGHDCVSYAALLSPDVWTFPSDKTNLAIRVHSRSSSATQRRRVRQRAPASESLRHSRTSSRRRWRPER
jgi:hypothetical protein